MDIFSDDAYTLQAVLEAGRAFYQRQGPAWPADWINAEMVAYVLNNAGCERLVAHSVQQGALMYDSKSFRVYAADWRYQVVGKIQRAYDQIVDRRNAEKDVSDMVQILHVLNAPRAGPLTRSEMLGWYYYGYRMGVKEVAFANAEYEKIYGRIAILDDLK